MMATVEQDICTERGSLDDLDSVMTVMEGAFGSRFGEAWTRSQLAGILPMSGVTLTVAREPANGAAVGFSLFRVIADEAELLLLAVDPNHHRRGVGRHLLKDFMQRSRNDRVARIHLEVRDGNPALSMYSDVGFAPVGRRRNYYHAPDGRAFDAVTLAYQL